MWCSFNRSTFLQSPANLQKNHERKELLWIYVALEVYIWPLCRIYEYESSRLLLRLYRTSPFMELVLSFHGTRHFLRLYWSFPLIVLVLSFDWTRPFLRLNWSFLSIELVLSFDFTKMPSPQRFYSEPSLSQRRALVVSMTSLRQLVKSKESVQ